MNNTKTVQVRDVPEDLWDGIRIQAITRKMTINDYVLSLLRRAVEKKA